MHSTSMQLIWKLIRSSTECVCLYSFLQVYGNIEEMEQELHKGLLLILLIKKLMESEDKWA